MVDRYAELYREFRWHVPERYNIAQACCGQWAADRSRIALYWEDESGATAAYSFWDIQVAANRLSNALAGLGVKRGDRVAILLPQRPETAIAYIAIFQMGAIALPLSHLFGPDALEYRMEHAEASVAIVESGTIANLWAIKDRLSHLRHVIGVDTRERGVAAWAWLRVNDTAMYAIAVSGRCGRMMATRSPRFTPSAASALDSRFAACWMSQNEYAAVSPDSSSQ